MPIPEEFAWLSDKLDECVEQAKALQLEHAVLLIRMAAMEVADRSLEHDAEYDRREVS
ncbi:hypothetical protein HNR60_004058 [Rhodopseudomonas rhenobacensis]|uniref:Uncharacterized protein n=1 Tax=Rhodopseudomonas rhenobacensis TaxID=87461 RepID=A0A7W7Z757_9BRAD|nr:hypothetical protein [Rhodopseudomonas rhenobacensis]MBB5049282.1 hypothetical protein [Rhodopseudomonas rhenobacensis]